MYTVDYTSLMLPCYTERRPSQTLCTPWTTLALCCLAIPKDDQVKPYVHRGLHWPYVALLYRKTTKSNLMYTVDYTSLMLPCYTERRPSQTLCTPWTTLALCCLAIPKDDQVKPYVHRGLHWPYIALLYRKTTKSNLMYTVDYTFSCRSNKCFCACSLYSMHTHSPEFTGTNFKQFKRYVGHAR